MFLKNLMKTNKKIIVVVTILRTGGKERREVICWYTLLLQGIKF